MNVSRWKVLLPFFLFFPSRGRCGVLCVDSVGIRPVLSKTKWLMNSLNSGQMTTDQVHGRRISRSRSDRKTEMVFPRNKKNRHSDLVQSNQQPLFHLDVAFTYVCHNYAAQQQNRSQLRHLGKRLHTEWIQRYAITPRINSSTFELQI